MRRFGGSEAFLDLIGQVRARAPLAGIRSNVIVGFPGETEADVAELEDFLVAARLDVVGVFGYSDEDGTEAETYDGKLASEVVAERLARVTDLVEQLTAQRAEERVGEAVDVLVEEVWQDGDQVVAEGRALHQGPDVDGTTRIPGVDLRPGAGGRRLVPGEIVRAEVVASEGVDLLGELVGVSGGSVVSGDSTVSGVGGIGGLVGSDRFAAR
jgi:ribosomal protein S12 methylthiotransferase